MSELRKTPQEKWNGMTIEEQVEVIGNMVKKGMIPAVVPGKGSGKGYEDQIRERFKNGHSLGFVYLKYEVQDKVASYLRKEYGTED